MDALAELPLVQAVDEYVVECAHNSFEAFEDSTHEVVKHLGSRTNAEVKALVSEQSDMGAEGRYASTFLVELDLFEGRVEVELGKVLSALDLFDDIVHSTVVVATSIGA